MVPYVSFINSGYWGRTYLELMSFNSTSLDLPNFLNENYMKNKVNTLADLGNLLNAHADAEELAWKDEVTDLVLELNVTEACASDVIYLRTRNRWSQDLEKELIALHKAGTPPMITGFGLDPETGESLVKTKADLVEESNTRSTFLH